MKNKILYIYILLFSLSVYAENFEVGTGSEFNLSFASSKKPTILDIYISESSFTKLGVEYYFKSPESLLAKKMWQQYIFKVSPNQPLQIVAGFVKEGVGKPIKPMDNNVFKLNKNGVQIEQFLFSDKKDLAPYKVADEKIETKAGMIPSTHYRKKNGSQTVDFWISDQVKPIGLVKLISTSPKEKKNNYQLELKSLLKNVKKTIHQP